MCGSRLLIAACGLVFFACVAGAAGTSVKPLQPDDCVQCFSENRRLAGRIEQLLVRVGQLEAELATQRGDAADGQGEREGS